MAAPNVPFYPDRLGMVSARNESAGRNDAINTNDLRGIHSYGKWQIYGTNIPRYLRSMAQMGGEYANIAARLGQYKVNSKAFDNAWRREARAHPDLIENSQYQFIKATHYDPVLKKLAPDLQNAINSNRGLQEALWQATVLGPAAAKGLFNKGWKEGNGDIRKLVDVVYRDMHNYQKSYIKEHPNHLPTLLRQHEVSRKLIRGILDDPKRNGMIAGVSGKTNANVPAQSSGSSVYAAPATTMASAATATPQTTQEAQAAQTAKTSEQAPAATATPAATTVPVAPVFPDTGSATAALSMLNDLQTSIPQQAPSAEPQFEAIAPLVRADYPSNLAQLNGLAEDAVAVPQEAPQNMSLADLIRALQSLAPQAPQSLASRIALGIE